MEFVTSGLGDRLRRELRRAARVDIAVAYFNPDPQTLQALQRVPRLRLLVSDDFEINDPDSLQALDSRSNYIRAVSAELHGGNLHAKVYLIERKDGTNWAMVGSANLTRPGLCSNQEACVILDERDTTDTDALVDIRTWIGRSLGRHFDPIDFALARAIFTNRSRRIGIGSGVASTQPDATYWGLKPGECGEYWNHFLAESVIAMGWEPMPDTSTMSHEQMLSAYRVHWPSASDQSVYGNVGQIRRFTQEMSSGQLVLLCGRYDSTGGVDRDVYIYGIARTLDVGGRCYFYDRRSRWWHFKRHAAIQRICEPLPRSLVARALDCWAFVPTIIELDRPGFLRLERVLRSRLGIVVSV
ncbi:MAG: phospholipase D-like domain-containing protein [Gemmataceae bacterium]